MFDSLFTGREPTVKEKSMEASLATTCLIDSLITNQQATTTFIFILIILIES